VHHPGEAAGCPASHIFLSLETTNVDAIFNILVLNQIILDLTNFIQKGSDIYHTIWSHINNV
jgi:hypothetical protein